MIDTIRTLSTIAGVSGSEDAVRDAILREIEDYADCRVDRLGNIIAFKKGAKTPKNKLMLAAHMDEVGLMITGIEENGMLRFTTVGGVDTRVILGRRVLIGQKGARGVVGAKAVHLQTSEEREIVPKTDSLLIDIGVSDSEEAAKHVSLGDTAVFDSAFTEFGDQMIKGRALDDRAGCAILISLLRSPLDYDAYFAFNVQEEVGLKGAKASAYEIDPDVAIVVEATTAADIADVPPGKQVCVLGEGPVVSFMDRSTIYDKELYQLAFEAAKRRGVKCQPKRGVYGGNEAGAIHLSRSGVRTIAVSLPCRYLHSPSCVLKKTDITDAARLISELIGQAAEM